METIGVGVIGASTLHPGWATRAHIPAIRASAGYRLVAVATNRADSARAAAESLGVIAYANHAELVANPAVDLVVVAVRAPEHYQLVCDALDAGKMTFCEWPLGVNLPEARDLAGRARESKIRTAIGLQGRFSSVVQQVHRLVHDGFIGEVLATTFVGSGIAWGGETDRSHSYMFDRAHGVNVLSVPALHALDTLAYALGEFANIRAAAAVRRPTVRIVDDGTIMGATAWDHVAISGTLVSGAPVSVYFRGGVSRGCNLYWEINGTQGDLALSSKTGNLQVADLSLAAGRGDATSLTPLMAASDGIVGNIARLYEAFWRDVRTGGSEVPNFAHALRRHELLEELEADA